MSANTFQPIRGFPDVFPNESNDHHFLIERIQRHFKRFGIHPVILPLVERTALFKRGVGEATDIVTKEMYTFEDRHGESIALRPEGTASMLRALLQSGYREGQLAKYQYYGPMFRHERPQKGRLRQFHQVGVESFGSTEITSDIELIHMCHTLWQILGIEDVTLELSLLGGPAAKSSFIEALKSYLMPFMTELPEEVIKRLETNPLRVLDSKDAQVQAILAKGPTPLSFLDASDLETLQTVESMLTQLGIQYHVNPFLVRGLDYYNGLVFEFKHQALGAQSTICAGGRYDALSTQLGASKVIPACGFSIGVERLLLLPFSRPNDEPLIYGVVDANDINIHQTLDTIRNALDCVCLLDTKGGSLKSQLKRANRANAQYALFSDTNEQDNYVLKDLNTGIQDTFSQTQLIDYLMKEQNHEER